MTVTRILFAVAAIILAVTTAPRATFAASDNPATDYQDQKVVYHNNGHGKDSADYFKALLKNIGNHIDAVGKDRVDIKVVNHGDGVSLFQQAQTDKTIAARIDDLRSKGVQFLICKNTLADRKLDWKQLYGVTEADLVPSGVAELIRSNKNHISTSTLDRDCTLVISTGTYATGRDYRGGSTRRFDPLRKARHAKRGGRELAS